MSCMSPIKYVVGSLLNSIVRKPVVGKFALRMSRPLPHVYCLSRLAQFVCVNYAYRVNISVKLHGCVGWSGPT